jgi:steroid 5-alpha reductase family enzyme
MQLLELYRTTDPLTTALWVAGGLALLCWVLSLITKEYSWVDRLWSITPALFSVHFAGHVGFDDPRLNLMAALTVLWGVRLTYNFARKGGYKPGGEDYRWEEIQGKIGPFWFQVLNATFLAPFQNYLLLLIVVPSYAAYRFMGTPLNALDYAAAVAFVVFFIGETVADEQQWKFQTAKYAAIARGETPDADFITTGLFRYSRHPNFFCEQAMWWTYYVFSIAAGAGWFNWTITGAVLLTLLFQASTGLTEKLSARKYPAYADYQRTTSRLMPEARHRTTDLVDERGVDRCNCSTLALAALRDDGAPGVGDQRVAVGTALRVVVARLRGRQHVTLLFDRAGTEQHVPVVLAGRERKRRRDRERNGAGVDQATVELGEPQVVADAQAERSKRGFGDDGVRAGLDRLRLE